MRIVRLGIHLVDADRIAAIEDLRRDSGPSMRLHLGGTVLDIHSVYEPILLGLLGWSEYWETSDDPMQVLHVVPCPDMIDQDHCTPIAGDGVQPRGLVSVTAVQLLLLEAVAGRVSDRHRCACGVVDTLGAGGPRAIVGEPGAYGCASSRWFCRPCLRAAWREHDERAAKLEARRERLELYRQGRLDICGQHYLSHEAHARICAGLAAAAMREAA